jgi:glyoxylase-like metal-dependent hydrolase (beta-lactamase superfamily II)
MEVERIEDGLWRWTVAHPAWTPDDDWDRIVGCVYHETRHAVVLVDPLVPEVEGERDRFFRALDADVARLGLPVVTLTTCPWHVRSAAVVAARYDARAIGPGEAATATLPLGVRAAPVPAADEVVWWLEEARTLVPGDTLLGDGAGGLRVCPASWLDDGGPIADLVDELRPLLALPVERVLVSHGDPVRSDGRAALARAIDVASA